MFRVTSLKTMSDGQLDRWVKRLVLLLVVGTVAFAAFYVFDRHNPFPQPSLTDRQIAAAEQAVAAKPGDVPTRGALADLYLSAGRFQDAVNQYDQIIATGTSVERAKFGRAGAYLGLNRLDESAADYHAVIDIAKTGEMANVDPMLEASWYGLGRIAMKQGKAADAIPFLENALAITRSDADAMYLLGTAFVQTGATDKAITEFRAAVAFVPIGWLEPYAALADAYTKSGKAAQAEWALAMVDLVNGQTATAEQRLKALLQGEAGMDALIGLGLAAEVRGDSAGAAAWYGEALKQDPNSSQARLGMNRVGPAPSALPALPTPGIGTGSSN